VLKNNEIVQFKFRFTADNAGFRLCGCVQPYQSCSLQQTDANLDLGSTAAARF
jgi:hypothetical protein